MTTRLDDDRSRDATPAVVIRRATPADAPTLGRLGAYLVGEHHAFDPARFLAPRPRTEEHYGEFLRGEIARPDAIVLVAERAGRLLGYTYADIEGVDYMALRGPAGVLHDIVVDPTEQGRGVGRRLLEATLAALRERGAPRVVLMTAAPNASAQRLFERMGFRRTMIEMTRELDE
jgi:ribosomal protein S18 acetylase RimI-like enzyme